MFRHMPDFNHDIVPAGGNHNALGRVYLFTNENIADYVKKFDMQGKRVLSVAAGGDHAFECLLNGASFVDTFDVNYSQKPIQELKTHMIKSLPYEDFMDFFFNDWSFFDKKILEPIWHDFSPELQLYLDWYYSIGPSAPMRMFVYGASDSHTGSVSYITSKAAYEQLAHKLPPRIKFTHLNAHDISSKIDTQYDFILLSNIFDYLDLPRADASETLACCYDKFLKPLSDKNLSSNGGHVLFNYMWDTSFVSLEKWNSFAKKFNRKKKDYGHKMHMLDIESPFDSDIRNNVLYMTQNQKVR